MWRLHQLNDLQCFHFRGDHSKKKGKPLKFAAPMKAVHTPPKQKQAHWEVIVQTKRVPTLIGLRCGVQVDSRQRSCKETCESDHENMRINSKISGSYTSQQRKSEFLYPPHGAFSLINNNCRSLLFCKKLQ